MTAEAPQRASAGRNDLVDALRFIAIEFVVMQHVLNLRGEFKLLPGAAETVRALLAFNMPLFVFVSGYVLVGREGRSVFGFLRGKALALLVPYLAWIIVELPLRRIPLADWPLRLVQALVDPSRGLQMWFLQVLFVVMVAFALVRAGAILMCADRGPLRVLSATGLIVAFLPLVTGPVSNLFGRFCWLYPFLVMGYVVGHKRAWFQRWDGVGAVIGVVGFPLLIASGYQGPGYQLAAGTLGALALWGIVRHAPARVHRTLGWLGQRTLGVYGWQMVVLPFLIVGAGWPGAFASWALVSVVAFVLTLVIERTAVTRALFLGRWPRRTPGRVVDT